MSRGVQRGPERDQPGRLETFPFETDQDFGQQLQLVRGFLHRRYHGGQGLGMIEDQAVLAYGTPLGRADTEFKLARVMAAYARTHDNVSVYFEDDNLAVYRISPKAASITALNVGDQR